MLILMCTTGTRDSGDKQMPGWKYRLPIKSLLHQDDNDPEVIRQAGLAIAKAIRDWPVSSKFDDLYDVAAELEEAAEQDDLWVQSCMNQVLDELYDFADEHRIWVE